jgi:uncharacterized protein YjdB
VTGTFADGANVTLTYSSLTTYAADNSAVATVDSTGLVTAVGPGSAMITMTNAGVSATVPVTVPQPVKVLSSLVTLHPSDTEQFEAHLAMPPGTDPSVTWSLHPTLGTIDDTGLYTAPSSVDSAKRVVVTATLVADPIRSGSAEVQLLPPISVSVTPESATVTAGATRQFNATVVNVPYPTVTWSVSPPGAGTIGRKGLYLAPATIASSQIVTVTATSEDDETKSASAKVTLVPRPR